MITGLSHITFICKNIEKTGKLLENIFGAKCIYSSGLKEFSISPEKFYMISNLWIAIMQGDSLKEKTYNHIAFKIEEEEVDNYIDKIKALNLEIREPRSRVKGEGVSIYFYDYDNHLFELHTGNLEERLKRYKAI